MRPGSHCPDCSAPIRPIDNIPLLSWMALRGRCRSCRGAISWRYPAVELATAALFLLSFLRFGLTLTGIGMDVLCFLLLGLAAMDAETMRLPDVFTLTGIGLGVIYAALLPAEFLTERLWHAGEALLWAFLAALLLLIIRWTYQMVRHVEGMGMGDVKLLAMIAAWLGPGPTILALVLGTFATALFRNRCAAAGAAPSAFPGGAPATGLISMCGGAVYDLRRTADPPLVFEIPGVLRRPQNQTAGITSPRHSPKPMRG